jgi:hypothetical protein
MLRDQRPKCVCSCFESCHRLCFLFAALARRPFANKLEQMYEHGSYTVHARVLRNHLSSESGPQGTTRAAYNLELQYEAQDPYNVVTVQKRFGTFHSTTTMKLWIAVNLN